MLSTFNTLLNKQIYVVTGEENSYKENEILFTEDFDIAAGIIEEHEIYEEKYTPNLYHGVLIPSDVLSMDIYKNTVFLLKAASFETEILSRNVYNIGSDMCAIKGTITHPPKNKWEQKYLVDTITSIANRTHSSIEKVFIFLGYKIIPKLKVEIEFVDDEVAENAEEIANKIEKLRNTATEVNE